MRLNKVKAIYSILMGLSIISLWSMLFITQQIPELETELFDISFHIFSELLLAITLIIGGINLLRDTKKSEMVFFLSMGLLVYSVINAAGYYGQQANWGMFGMFGTFAIISTILVILSLKR